MPGCCRWVVFHEAFKLLLKQMLSLVNPVLNFLFVVLAGTADAMRL
jgi:hypothetical protein